MSKTLVPEVMPTTDIQPFEMEKLQSYMDEGLPGIGTLDDDNLARAMELYLSGKSYREISQVIGKPKVMFLYLSRRYNWFQMKMDYLDELDQTIKTRLDHSKLTSSEFLLKLSHALQKKMARKIDKYLATDDEQYLDDIDPKQMDKYLKVIEVLHRGDAPKSAPVGVNINMNAGMTASKNADGSIDFTPKEKSVAAKLKEMADLRRSESAQMIGTDINKDTKREGDPK